MLKKIKDFYESEYKDTKRVIDKNVKWMTPREIVYGTIQRCLGIAMFAQNLGVSYEDIEPLYNEYKKKLEDLLETKGE